jgi:flavin-dependent dehydrogenase
MTNKYDLVVIGAGPAGLMAAKTAAENNLTVALVEKRRDITRWARADCMMFYGLEGGFLGENIKIEPGRIIFPNNGFEVKYSGPLYPLMTKRAFSPAGHRIDFCGGYPLALMFDKGILLRDLLGQAQKSGVVTMTGALGVRVENTQKGAKLLVVSNEQEQWIEGRKIIAADGINSRITESIGLNKDRTFMGILKVVQYVMENVACPYPNSWMNFYGKSLSPVVPLHFHQTVMGEKLHKLGAVRLLPGNPEEDLRYVMEKSCFAPWFKEAKIAYKMATSFKAFSPIARPVAGNVLVIGDAADSGEVENQGALMCGFHAGNAAVKELLGESGFDEYCGWWQKSFEFFSPEVNRVAHGFAINPHYEDEEIDYLFSLVEGKTLTGTVVQYKTPKIMWDAILEHRERIASERPALINKIDSLLRLTVQEALAAGAGKN